jgi:hypothetical protein
MVSSCYLILFLPGKQFLPASLRPALRVSEGEKTDVTGIITFYLSYEAVANPGRIAPTIEYGIDPDDLILNPIIDGKRKSFGEKSVTAEVDCMNTRINMQRFKVREEGIEEVLTESL